MSRLRQRHIPLGIEERLELDRRKQDYEEKTGDVGDWGKFLSVVTLAGLAALGVYSVAQAGKFGPTIWQLKCPQCGVRFPIQVPNPPPWRLAPATCVKCESSLVVDFARPSTAANVRDAGPDSLYCHYCEQPIEAGPSKVSPDRIEYLRCGRCERVARVRTA